MLGEALKANTSLILIDLSHNKGFNDNMEFHSELTDSLINCSSSKLQKIRITTESIDVKAHYLDLIDQRPSLKIFNNRKLLEDVDVQDD